MDTSLSFETHVSDDSAPPDQETGILQGTPPPSEAGDHPPIGNPVPPSPLDSVDKKRKRRRALSHTIQKMKVLMNDLEAEAEELDAELANLPIMVEDSTSPIHQHPMEESPSPVKRASLEFNQSIQFLPPREDLLFISANEPANNEDRIIIDQSDENNGEEEEDTQNSEDEESDPPGQELELQQQLQPNPDRDQEALQLQVPAAPRASVDRLNPRRPMEYFEEFYSNPDLVMLTNRLTIPPIYPAPNQPCGLCGILGEHFTADCATFLTLGQRRRALNDNRRCWICVRQHRPPCAQYGRKVCPVCGSRNHGIVVCPRFNPDIRYFRAQQ